MCRERSSMRVWKTHGENVKKNVLRLKHLRKLISQLHATIGFGIQIQPQEFALFHQVCLVTSLFTRKYLKHLSNPVSLSVRRRCL